MADADIPFPLTHRKMKTQTLGGSVTWNYSIRLILKKWQPFFNFFIMADADILFPSTLRKLETQTLGGFGNLKFFRTINIKEMAAIFHFFHNGRHWYLIDSGKTGDVNFLLVQFSKFSVGSVFSITHPRFCYNIHAWLPIKHLCMDIYVRWPFCTKKCQKKICQNRLTHLCVAVVNRLGNSSSHQQCNLIGRKAMENN